MARARRNYVPKRTTVKPNFLDSHRSGQTVVTRSDARYSRRRAPPHSCSRHRRARPAFIPAGNQRLSRTSLAPIPPTQLIHNLQTAKKEFISLATALVMARLFLAACAVLTVVSGMDPGILATGASRETMDHAASAASVEARDANHDRFEQFHASVWNCTLLTPTGRQSSSAHLNAALPALDCTPLCARCGRLLSRSDRLHYA